MERGMARSLASVPTRALHWSPARVRNCSVRASHQGTDLREWVEKQGGYVWRGLRIADDGAGSGLGLVATEPLSRGETLIALPSHLPLSLPSPASSNLSPQDASLLHLVERVPEELWALRLGLKLLSEKAKESSFWWPYISHLPHRFQLPIFFSGDDIAGLQYPPLINQVKKRCQFLGQLASKEIPTAFNMLSLEHHPFRGQFVSTGALGWAMAAVSSRAFRAHCAPGTTTRMMLPLIDMCNHSFSPNARLVQIPSSDNRDYELQVVAESTLEAGMPIALNYGTLSNDLLLLDYGFIVPENPHDRIDLKFDGSLLDAARYAVDLGNQGPPSFSSPSAWQQSILTQLRLQGPEASLQVTLGGPDLVESRLLAALRILYADDASQLRNQKLEKLQKWALRPPLGVKNERNVLRTLAALSAIVLTRSFPTTMQEDKSLLEDLNLSEFQRAGIEYRLGKKQLLLNVIHGLKEKINALKVVEIEDTGPSKSKTGKGFG